MLADRIRSVPVVGVTYSTWSPTNKGGSVDLSNGNRTAAARSLNSVRGSQARSSGKYQFEITISGTTPVASLLGVATSAASLTNYPGSGTGGWAYYASDGHFYNQGSDAAYGSSFTAGDVIGVVVDFSAGTLKFYKNGVDQGVAYSGTAGKTLYPIFGSGSSSSVNAYTGTINTGQSSFSYPVSGASAWG